MHTHKMDVPQYQKLEGCGGLLTLQHQEIAPNVFYSERVTTVNGQCLM